MIVDIGVSTSDITALQHAGAVVVLTVSNSVKDWNAPYWNARSDWSAKIKMTNAVALDTEYATDEDYDQIFSQQGFISAFKDVKSLLYAVDNETCEKKFRSMASMGWTNLRSVGVGWTNLRSVGDAYSNCNMRHINPCTDVIQTIVAAGAGIPEKSVDPVKLLKQCKNAAGSIWFDCTPDYPCDATHVANALKTPNALEAIDIILKRANF